MIYELEDTSKAAGLFACWEDTCILSCLQKVMGKVYVTDTEEPRSAMAVLESYAFCAGEPERELLSQTPEGGAVLVPLNEGWAKLIEERFPNAQKAIRYAIKKDTRFRKDELERMAAALPAGYELRAIDDAICDMCFADPFAKEYVATFGSKEMFMELGRGFVILKDGRIVSGASSYSRYREGIEVQVITAEEERQKGLACVACAALILSCLEDGLYPSWDAANLASVHLAEKLGYEFSQEYISYEVERLPETEEEANGKKQ